MAPKREDLTGKVFSHLKVVSFSHSDKKGNSFQLCECDCGNKEIISRRWLIDIKKKNSCSKCFKEYRYQDVNGLVFGKLTVIRETDKRSGGCRKWECKCECGDTYFATTTKLISGRSTKCPDCAIKDRAIAQTGVPKVGPGEANRKAVQHYYKSRAKKRGFPFTITFDQFCELTAGNCHYCGKEPGNSHCQTSLKASGAFIHNGIDRKDNKRGYEPDNVVSCCCRCNRAKNIMNYDEFIEWIHQVSDRFKR